VIRILFGIIATLGVLAALGTVLARNLVHAALFLVAFFFLIACQFVLLEAEFMAAMQVLVYIGAVAIILMFGIMLTRNIQGDETTGGHWIRKVAPGAAALALFATLVVAIKDERGLGQRAPWKMINARTAMAQGPIDSTKPTIPTAGAINNMSKTVGEQMMTRYVIGFEVAGLLLTAAIVGAVALAQGDPKEEEGMASSTVATGRPSSAPASGNGHTARPASTHGPVPTTPTSAS
jgi:NADH-quinone oxidoreductase subunit J